MTRPGTVAEQPTMPSKASIERLREPGAQRDAAARSDEVEGEFSELLSKLKTGDGQRLDESGLPNSGSRPTELRQTRRREIDARIAQDEGDGDVSLRAADCFPCSDPYFVSDPHLEGATVTSESDVPPVHPLELDTTTVNDIAAMITLTPVQPPRASQAADPIVASRAILDGSLGDGNFGPAEARLALQVVGAAKGQLEQNVEGRTPPAATELIFPSARAPEAAMPGGPELPAQADVPKPSVLRNESHFAPVSPSHAGVSALKSGPSVPRKEVHFAPVSSSRAGVPALESSPLGIEPHAKGGQSAVAPSVDTALPSAEEPVSVPVPPAQQIADRITAESAAFERADPAGATPDQPGTKPVLKVLQIQLQPADLGTVTVRMELKADGLKLHVEADRAETAEIIRNDQDTLSKLLRSAGYGVDPGSIRIVEGDRTVASTQAGQQGAQANLQSSTQSQSGWSERQERAQRGNTGTNDGDAQIPTNRNEIHETTTNRTGRDLYV